nr:hypothetical protein GCM10025732_34160 [Glycomyces mayteni]
MEFLILGALEARHDGRTVPISGAHQRKALALLLLEEGRTVPMQRLIEALWGDRPPATAQRQVRNIVSAVRRGLAPADPIERSGDGYRLRTDATDWAAFRTEVAQARSTDDPEKAHGLLLQALDRWRGPALAGLDGDLIDTAVVGMEEERLTASEDCFAAALALGFHRETAGEIQALAAEHPYRQRLTGHLMLALYRSGDGAAALRVYTDHADRLADELGIEPDRTLRERYVAILREDPDLDLEAPQAEQVARAVREDPVPEEPAPRTPQEEPPPRPQDPVAARPRALPSRSAIRLAAFGFMVLLMGLVVSHDGLGLAQTLGGDDPIPEAELEPVWTYPALESGSAVIETEAGLLIRESTGLRLEADGAEVWSRTLDRSRSRR